MFESGPWMTDTTVCETERKADLKIILQCSYNISTSKAKLRLHPGDLMLHIFCRSGKIAWSRVSHYSDKLALPCSVVESGSGLGRKYGENLTYIDRIACCIWQLPDDVARRAWLETKIGREPLLWHTKSMFVRSGESLPCCSEAVLRAANELLRLTMWRGEKKIDMHII